MAEVNLGEAIASGTNRQPERDMPITRGLQMQEQVSFRDNQAELRKQAELNKRKERAAKILTSFDKGKWHNKKYQAEFGEYLKGELPTLLDAYNSDPITFAQKQQDIMLNLGKLQAIDNDEYEIFAVDKKGSATRPLAKELFSKQGMQGIMEHDRRYWFAPIGIVEKDSGRFRVNDVYTKNIDSSIDEKAKLVLGDKYKQVGKVGAAPLLELDVTDPSYKENENKIIGNLLMDKDFKKSVLYDTDFKNYYDVKLQENGLDPEQVDETFVDKVYTDFVTDRFKKRVLPKQKVGPKPTSGRSGGGSAKSVIIVNDDGSFYVKGQPFNHNPSTSGDGSYVVGSKAGSDAIIGFPGFDGKINSTFQVINPNVKYLGNDEWQVVGGVKNQYGKTIEKTIKVTTDNIRASLGLDNNSMAMYGYKPKPRVATPQPQTNSKPKKKKLSLPEWQKQNPKGTIADYKKYFNS